MEIAKPPKDKFVEVSVSTTAGFYPRNGTDRNPAKEKIQDVLDRAKRKLKLNDVANWVASVNGPAGSRELDPQKNYIDSGLSGTVEIDWGPREGGGGG